MIILVTIMVMIIGIFLTYLGYIFRISFLETVSGLFGITSAFILFLEVVAVLMMRNPLSEAKREITYLERYNTLMQIIEIENTPSIETVKEVYQYNTEVKLQRYYQSNIWFSCFSSKAIAKQPLIELKNNKIFEKL